MARLPVKKTYKLYVGGEFRALRVGPLVRGRGAQRRPRVAEGPPRRRSRRAAGVRRLGRPDGVQPRPDPLPGGRDDGSPARRSRRGLHRAGRGGRSHRSPRLVRGLGRQARPGARLREPGCRPVLQLHRARAHGRRRRPVPRRAAARGDRHARGAGDRVGQHRRCRRVGAPPGRGDRARGGAGDVRPPRRRRQHPHRVRRGSSRRGSPRTWT